MNSIFLILGTLVIYIFGYRYFARFLQKTVFRIPLRPAATQAPTGSIVERLQKTASARHELLGFHFATIATLTTISGAAVAVFWGWAPAFLWLLVGSSVAAGSFAIGSLWLRRRFIEDGDDNGTGSGLVSAVGNNLPARLALPFLLLLLLTLTGFAGLFVYFAGIMLVSFPSITWPMIVILALLGLLSRVITNQPAELGSRGTSFLVSIVVVLLSIWVSQGKTIGFSGSLNFDLSGGSLVSVDGITIWSILVLLFSLFVQRRPFEDWQKNFGVLTAIMTVLMLLVFYIGIAIAHPTMSAPALAPARGPGLLPWLFLTLTSGAYAGLHFLFAFSVTAPRLQDDADIRYLGYGGALLEGLMALTVVLVFGALIGNKDVWSGLYQNWSALPDGSAMLGHYVNGVILAAGYLGLGNGFSETWTALVLTCLSIVSAIALLRVMRVLIQELGVRYRAERLGAVKTASWTGFGVLLLAMVLINASAGIKTLEQLLGANQYLLASIGLLVIINALARRKLPVTPVWVLFGLTVLLSLLGSGALVLNWSGDVLSLRLLTGLALILLQLALVAGIGLDLWRRHQVTTAADRSTAEPPEN